MSEQRAKRPSISGSFPLSHADVVALKENMEIVSGRRGMKCDLEGLANLSISSPPTQAEMEFLRAQLYNLVKRLEE
jgi:hypothetical protein